MKKFFNSLDPSDWIQVVAIAATVIISLVSIVIASKSLRMTRKSIEDANKPYIGCYVDMVDVGHFQKYIVVKNFGKTPATIISIEFDKEIDSLGRNGKLNSLENTLIAPGQNFISVIDSDEKATVIAKVIYKDMENQLTHLNFTLNLDFTSDLMYMKSTESKFSDETNELLNLFHNLTKRTL